jgi:hypothetical protein
MADGTNTNPTAPGPQTSEFKLTVVALIVGAILEGASAVLHGLQEAGTQAPWIPGVLAVIGALLQVASIFGYQKGRAVVKSSMILSEPAQPTSVVTTPKV